MTEPNLLNKPPRDAFIYSGNQHESVPRALFFDKRLTPLERNAWQIIRMMLASDGITAIPTYEELRPYLTSMPNAEKASFETVTRALTILRLSRWLSLARKRRAKDGTKQSNLYVLHDEPLTAYEAMRIDDDYLVLVCNSITHASKAIQQVATLVLDDIDNDPYLSGKRLPTRLEILLGRLSTHTESEKDEMLSTGDKSEESNTNSLRNQNLPLSESEAGVKPLKTQFIRIPKSTVCSSSNNKNILLHKPDRFYTLSEKQQNGVLQAMKNLSSTIQLQILNEWDNRCQSMTIRKPAAYLLGIIQKALKGELNEFAQEPTLKKIDTNKFIPPVVKSNQKTVMSTDESAKIQSYINNLKKLISVSKR